MKAERTRAFWADRATALRRSNGWVVGRTDLLSYTGPDCEYVHYAYPPRGGGRVEFWGTPVTALRDAVLFAEARNREIEAKESREGSKL